MTHLFVSAGTTCDQWLGRVRVKTPLLTYVLAVVIIRCTLHT
jgi:hypothetical protein